MILNSSCHLYSICTTLYTNDSNHFLFLSLPFYKTKQEEKTPFPGTTCLATHHLAFFSFSSPSSSGKIQLLLLHWIFHLRSPTFPIFQFLLPAKLTTLFFFPAENIILSSATSYSRIYLWILLRLSDYEDIPWVFCWLIYMCPLGKIFLIQLLLLCLQRTNGMSWT